MQSVVGTGKAKERRCKVKIKCKGDCGCNPHIHDSLDGYCMICASNRIHWAEQLQAELDTRIKNSLYVIKMLHLEIDQLQAKLDTARRDLTSIANCEDGQWAELAKATLKELRKE